MSNHRTSRSDAERESEPPSSPRAPRSSAGSAWREWPVRASHRRTRSASTMSSRTAAIWASGIKHIVQLGFDNVHFFRDNPNVPSDLQMMPNLVNFFESNGTFLSNNHTPLIAHTGDDLLTTATGLYGDRQGIGDQQQLPDLQRRRHHRHGQRVRLLDRPGLRHRQDAEPRPRHQPVDGLLARPRRPPPTTPSRRTRSPRRRGCPTPGLAATSATSRRPTWCSRTTASTSRRCSVPTRRRSSS